MLYLYIMKIKASGCILHSWAMLGVAQKGQAHFSGGTQILQQGAVGMATGQRMGVGVCDKLKFHL